MQNSFDIPSELCGHFLAHEAGLTISEIGWFEGNLLDKFPATKGFCAYIAISKETGQLETVARRETPIIVRSRHGDCDRFCVDWFLG